MLLSGDSIEKNVSEGVRYCKIAADQGHDWAAYNYAVMLEKGEGVGINKKEAARYYKIAADNGHPKAMQKYEKLKIYESL